MAAIAELKAVLGLDTGPWKRGMDGAKKEVKSFSADVKGTMSSLSKVLGAGIGIGAITAFTRSALKDLGDISDAAERLGMTTQTWQTLRASAEKFGIEMGNVEQAFYKLKTVQGDVLGNDKMAEAFRSLGISVTDVIALAPEDLFSRIGLAVKEADDKQAAYNNVVEIFGQRVGPRMVSLLNDMAQGMSAMSAEATRAGQVVDDELIQKADKFDLAWTRAIRAVKIGWVQLVSDITSGPGKLRDLLGGGSIMPDKSEAEAKRKAKEDAAEMGRKRAEAQAQVESAAQKKRDAEQHKTLAEQDAAFDAQLKKEKAERKMAKTEGVKAAKERVEVVDDKSKSLRDRAASLTIGSVGGIKADTYSRMGAQVGGPNNSGKIVEELLRDIRDAILNGNEEG
jgi:hypothetical protein